MRSSFLVTRLYKLVCGYAEINFIGVLNQNPVLQVVDGVVCVPQSMLLGQHCSYF
jgi:hypothetical protein